MTNAFNKIFLLFLIGLLVSCGGKEGVKAIFKNRTPHEAYAHNLEKANFHNSALGQAWLKASQTSLLDSVLVPLPFRETGYFKAEKPAAFSYSFKAKRGELIDIKVTTRTKQDIRLFLDLFEKGADLPREIKHVKAADTTNLSLQETVSEDQTYLVRLQPELLQNGSFIITIISKPSLSFPVQGKSANAVQSFWGADRDGGARRHEGVDIFATRGTPAIASTKGIVSRVNETPIGGKVVWLTDAENRQSLYYAHLDKQLVQPGQVVNPGDTLGLVGNTGNAKATPPHLHFGIYRYGMGAVDPYPFIYDSGKKPAAVSVNEKLIGEWARVKPKNAPFRNLPDGKASLLAKLPKHAALLVLAGSASWYKVKTPDGITGYVHKENLEGLQKPISNRPIKTETEITDQPENLASPIGLLPKDSTIAVLALYQKFQLVQLKDGTMGWLPKG